MHNEILSKEQVELLSFVKAFGRKFYLVGGTAIALHIGHRYSIDFDLFAEKPFSIPAIQKKVYEINKYPISNLYKAADQAHFLINGVKITFFHYPFEIPRTSKFDSIISMPSLLTLGAMKAFALGGRNKWKDYVDLYFLLKDHYSFEEISKEAERLYNGAFNAKLFRQQLSYFNDIDYAEEVFYLPGFEVSEEIVKEFLTEISTRPF